MDISAKNSVETFFNNHITFFMLESKRLESYCCLNLRSMVCDATNLILNLSSMEAPQKSTEMLIFNHPLKNKIREKKVYYFDS